MRAQEKDVEGKLYEITKPKQYDPKDVEGKCEIHNMVGYKCVNCGESIITTTISEPKQWDKQPEDWEKVRENKDCEVWRIKNKYPEEWVSIPKELKKFLLTQQREKLRGEIEGVKIKTLSEDPSWKEGYNQAIDEVLKKLSK